MEKYIVLFLGEDDVLLRAVEVEQAKDEDDAVQQVMGKISELLINLDDVVSVHCATTKQWDEYMNSAGQEEGGCSGCCEGCCHKEEEGK